MHLFEEIRELRAQLDQISSFRILWHRAPGARRLLALSFLLSSSTAIAQSRPLTPTQGLQRDASIANMLTEVDPARIRFIDSMLVSFGTRNTFSDTLSNTRGIGAARRWIYAQFQQYSRDCGGCLQVEYDAKVQAIARAGGREANIVNVLARLPGRDTMNVIVMSGHYDSCVCGMPGGGNDSVAYAPGADDDGSGTSAVIELARVFSKRFPRGFENTIIFVTVASEEQGLNGARQLAERLHGEGKRVLAAMTDDIVGNVVAEDGTTDSTSFRIFATDPDNSPSRELGRYVWGLNRLYMPAFEVIPVWRLDRIGRGGDHSPYIALGDPGLRFTERLENYNRQHLPTDELAHVNFGYVANIARANAVSVASLAMAPAVPMNARAARQGRAAADTTSGAARAQNFGGQAWTLSWQASPGATSYEVVSRRTTAATWEHVIPVGTATSCTLKRQLDDEWAGVRAVGANGARSLVASMPAPNPPPAAQATAAAGRGGRGQPGTGGAPTGGRGGAGAAAQAGNAPPRPAAPPPLCGAGA